MLSVVVPALNEEKNLYGAVTDVIYSANEVGVGPLDVVVINDGSRDGTQKVIERLEKEFPFVRHIRYESNRGLGACFFEAVKMAKYEKIAFFAGDNNVTTHLTKNLLRSIQKADLVVSYVINTESRNRSRRYLSSIFTLLYSLAFDIPLKYINGNPVYSKSQLQKLDVKARRYSFQAEVAVKLFRQGASFYEVPGYINPERRTSSAVRLKNFKEVLFTYLRLFYEIHLKDPKRYRHKGARALE